MLCFALNSFGQKITVEPYVIGERVPNIALKNIINYKDSSAIFSSFGHKLIILDFWHTHCGSCIAMFPLEDSLQQAFRDKVQFILITQEGKRDVIPFLHRWDSVHHTQLLMPIVTTDVLLNKMFAHFYNPHYVWLAPDGTLLAQTSEDFIGKETIEQILKTIHDRDAHLHSENFPSSTFRFPPPDAVQKEYFINHSN